MFESKLKSNRIPVRVFDWMIGALVAIALVSIVFYYYFYSMFEEAVNRIWEEIDKIKEKIKEKKEEAEDRNPFW